MRTKWIVSLGVAQELIKRGYQVVDVKKSSRVDGWLLFGFQDTEELRKSFANIVNK